ncbi:MAG: DUF1002 domain-containing protein [Eubacterium sp.]|nr:DUF1002 domain-containing protein [Eubacterium sp.]
MKKITWVIGSLLMAWALLFPAVLKADAVEDKGYIALGADLTKEEKKTVLRLLGVDQDSLSDYQVVTISNRDEHEALDSYLDSSIIGSRALSSVLIEKSDKGDGITVTTRNITYCTEGMYRNALSTAGVSDARIVVAGPFDLSGTAALVGAMHAYEDMTGKPLSDENKDAATNELIVTGDLAEEIDDPELAEEFIALLKKKITEEDIKSSEDVERIIDECCEELDVELSEEDRAKIRELTEKIDTLNLNLDDLKRQAGEIYKKIDTMDIDSGGIIEKIRNFFHRLFG